MPLYTYKCEICDKLQDSYNTIARRHIDTPMCECGRETKLSIQPTQIQPVMGGSAFPGYMCPVTDTYVTSRRKRRYIMDSNNLIEVGDRKPSKERAARTEAHESS